MIRDWLVPVLWVSAILIPTALVADWLIGWRPRFGLEAEFQRIINEAQIVDHYRGAEGGGWDSEDVTDRICNQVNSDILNGMGIKVDDRTKWDFLVNGSMDKPENVWRILQDKGAWQSCQDRSRRLLKISIDRQTSVCTAVVTVLPTCDL